MCRVGHQTLLSYSLSADLITMLFLNTVSKDGRGDATGQDQEAGAGTGRT